MNIFDWANANFDPETDEILVTGASSGIGYEFFKLLSKIGGNIYIVSDEDEKLENISSEFNRIGKARVKTIKCDFNDPGDLDNLLTKISNLNIKILVNNAGIGMKGLFTSYQFADIDKIYQVNTCAPLKILSAVLPKMYEKNCGVVIQVTTVNVVTPMPLNSIYTGSKAGLSSTFMAIMYEGKETGVLFQELRPGTTNTPFHKKQGVVPQSMLMSAESVAQRSLKNIHKKILYPNKIDCSLVTFGHFLPIFSKMGVGLFFLKKRLGIR